MVESTRQPILLPHSLRAEISTFAPDGRRTKVRLEAIFVEICEAGSASKGPVEQYIAEPEGDDE